MEQNIPTNGSSKDSNNESTENNETLISTETLSNQANGNQNLQECAILGKSNTNDKQLNATSSRSYPDRANTKQALEYRNSKQTALQISSNLPSLISINTVLPNYPESLYLLALAKLRENSFNLTISDENELKLLKFHNNLDGISHSELKTPDSLSSAPPSYSFVLRQMARRRPRLMGTFIPSPSFVQQTPPPNYGTAFDIYIDNPIPPPQRVYRFGYMPMIILCPECGYIGVTTVITKITVSTHLCALVLCLLCCWVCAPLPYILRSCKEVYHYCRNCRMFVGMYCPTNPENTNA